MQDNSLYAIFVILLIFSSVNVNWDSSTSADSSSDDQLPSQVTNDPLYIYGNSDFEFYNFPGSGSLDDPYVIENLIINSISPSISVTQTTAHFVIRHCILSSSDLFPSSNQPTVEITSVSNGKIEECIIDGGTYGIRMAASSNVEVRVCNISNTDSFSILLAQNGEYSLDNCTLSGGVGFQVDVDSESSFQVNASNVIVNGGILGIFSEISDSTINGSDFGQIILIKCENVTIADGIFLGLFYAIQFYQCWNCTIAAVEFQASPHPSFHSVFSTGNRIVDCTFTGSGILFDGSSPNHWQHFVENSTVNNKLIGYFHSQQNKRLNLGIYSQIVIVECKNLTLMNMKSIGVSNPISIVYSESCTVENISVSQYGPYGLRVLESDRCTLRNSTFTEGEVYAVYVNGSTNFRVIDFTSTRSLFGSEFIMSNNSVVTMSRIDAEYYAVGFNGVYDALILFNDFQGSIFGHGSERIEIGFNNIQSEFEAITLSNVDRITIYSNIITESAGGIRAFRCSDIFVSSNTITDIEFTPIMIEDVNDLQVIGNEIENASLSVNIIQTTNSSISQNTFLDCMMIVIIGCENIEFNNNSIENFTGTGVDVGDCRDISISNCLVANCGLSGILIRNTEDCRIQNTTITRNLDRGLVFERSANGIVNDCNISKNLGFGVLFESSDDCEVHYSSISENTESGIHLLDSYDCIMSSNILARNENYGIEILGGGRHAVFYNVFNENGIANAFDSGNGNTWDDTEQTGNYWSDYSGFGTYQIPGYAEAVDRYPRSIGDEGAYPEIIPPYVYSGIALILILGVFGTSVFWNKHKSKMDVGNPLPDEELHYERNQTQGESD